MDVEEARTIGERARMIRRRRGLSLDVAAGLAGITKGYLSILEYGQRGLTAVRAIRALDAADRAAPAMVRNHPLAREVLSQSLWSRPAPHVGAGQLA